jgi:hypothetical protein
MRVMLDCCVHSLLDAVQEVPSSSLKTGRSCRFHDSFSKQFVFIVILQTFEPNTTFRIQL